MNLSCSARMIKYLMFIFNLIFVITGITLIVVGTTVKTIYTDYSYFLNDQYFSLPNMLIATGALIFFISFFGCCGAIKENWILLGIFSILLIIIFIFEFSAGIAGYVLRDKTANYIDSALEANLYNYQNETHAVWDLIQSNFQCCGVISPSDWSSYFNNTAELPLSCCPAKSGTVGVFYCNYNPTTPAPTTPAQSTVPSTITNPVTNTTASSSETPSVPASTTAATTITSPKSNRRRRAAETETLTDAGTTTNSTSPPYTTGCKSAFGDYIRKHAVQIGGCAMGLAVIQLLGIFFSCHLVRQLKNGYYST